jgi:hypothetical protein
MSMAPGVGKREDLDGDAMHRPRHGRSVARVTAARLGRAGNEVVLVKLAER